MSTADMIRTALGLHHAGRLEEAEAVYREILSSQPRTFHALHFLGVLRAQSGDMAEAAALIGKALEIKSDDPLAHFHLAGALLPLGRKDEALASYSRAAALKPDFAEAHHARAGILLEMHRYKEALEACDRAIALRSDQAEAHHNRGHALVELGRNEEALSAFDRAIALKPDFVEAHNNRGSALLELDLREEAVAAFRQALALKPDFAQAYYNLGNALVALGKKEEALAAFDRAITLKPDFAYAAFARFTVAAQLCNWHDHAERVSELERYCKEGGCPQPFTMLYVLDAPDSQLLAAKTKAGAFGRVKARRPVQTHARLRIAYLSPDYHEHPVAYQTAELLERHDKTRFETYGVCLRPGPESAIRQRLCRAFDHFAEAGALSDRGIAQLLAESQIDIAVDLGGYTDSGRTKSLSFRPAPIAVNYLGYAGTLGADYVDYIVADAQVIPPESECFYTEKVVRLPDCFMPSDTAGRALPAPPRSEAGLPQKGFVFCTFNNGYKLNPQMFDIWMRLLRAVDGSVLWLNIGDEKVRGNLRAEAAARQVAPERLIFAGRTDAREDHLARLALADLFLDTLPYNAHATASDALRAGVPLVTCMGRSFAARVAGSLLTAIGAEELITHDLNAYEALALALARSPERLAAVRAKLIRNRTSHPLFDTARLARHLESAYQTMWDLHLKGQKPQSFTVNSLAE
jgi:predicted O-linked N-acetylglucosamine transferase (SPINDLY family)